MPVLLAALAPVIFAAGCGSPPSIVQARLSRTTIFSDQSTRVNVTVNDKNGLDDIVGAHLYSGDRTYWFGSFYEVSDGVFEYVIDWPTLNDHQPIYFDFPIARPFVVVVEDNEGEVDEVAIQVNLSCRAGDHACDGACYPVDVDCADV